MTKIRMTTGGVKIDIDRTLNIDQATATLDLLRRGYMVWIQAPDDPPTEKWNIALSMSKSDDVFVNQPIPGRVIFAHYYYRGTELWEYEPQPETPDWVETFMTWIRTTSQQHISATTRIGES